MTKEQLDFIQPILYTFENEDIKIFAEKVIDDMPDYIWEVGASSTGKYHPKYTLGELGLMKHQIAVVRFINFFFELEQYKKRFDSRQRDLMRLAALTHDARKSGSQEDYKKSKYTKFNHPLLMAKEYMLYVEKGYLSKEELKFIATLISKHMGQWNTDKKSNIELPKPNDEASELLHLADYLASRKCLDMSFDDYLLPKEELPDINTYKMPFGKHKDMLIKEVPIDYIEWLSKQSLKEPLKTFTSQLLNHKETEQNNN